MQRAPLEVLVLSFPDDDIPEGVAGALQSLREGGDLRVVSMLTVRRPLDGPPELQAMATFDDIGDVVADIEAHAAVGLLDADDVDQLVSEVPQGSTAVLVLVEHVWAVGIAAEIRASGGVLLDAARLAPDRLAAAEDQLGGSRDHRER